MNNVAVISMEADVTARLRIIMSTSNSVPKYPRLDEIRRIDLPHYDRDDGELVALEAGAQVPFVIKRIFTIIAPPGAKRGNHAHRRCAQFLLCVCGAVDVYCDDGREDRIFTLDHGDQALLVPPMIWNTVDFRKAGSTIIVLCDRRYERDDYILDYTEFTSMRNALESQG
jgi:mannose-6-phosphate isomerase-like protein (cupin superfamily)